MKTVFITGGATGIGAAAVRKFHAEGWAVVFLDVNAEAASALVDECGADTVFVEGNTRCRDDIERAVAVAVARFGRIDSVVANAGIHRKNTILDITDDELDLMIDTNIYGSVNTLRCALPVMIASGGGTVVINASDQWFVGKSESFAYGLTKGALGQITRSLAVDLAQYGIRVNAVCAGTIDTPLVDNVFRRLSAKTGKSVEEYRLEEDALFPLGRMGRADEVAQVIYFLASDASSFVTGSHYLVDGGLVAKG